MSWDECLPDCPTQKPVVVCVGDPAFPTTTPAVNYTTSYEPGLKPFMNEVSDIK